MDVADHLRLRKGEEVAVVQQILGCALEAFAADVGFLHAVGADGRAHRSVDDGDSIFENLFQRMSVGCSHFHLMSLIGCDWLRGSVSRSSYVQRAVKLNVIFDASNL